MKRRKSFMRRHIIAISFLILVAAYSITSTLHKQNTLNDLELTSQETIAEIERLEMVLREHELELSKVDTLDYVERYARERFKMVKPDEIYFQMIYD